MLVIAQPQGLRPASASTWSHDVSSRKPRGAQGRGAKNNRLASCAPRLYRRLRSGQHGLECPSALRAVS